MSNIEGMYSVYFILRQSEAIPSFDILRFDIRYSAVLCFSNFSFKRRWPDITVVQMTNELAIHP
jgi:hypothetical protein